MLQLQPTARLSIADTIAHPWMQGKMATQSDVIAEFRRRHEMIKEQQRAEAAAAAQQQAKAPGQKVRRDFKLGDAVYVDVTFSDAQLAQKEESKDSTTKLIQLKMKPYTPEVFSNTVLFSTLKPDEICAIVSQALQEHCDIKVAISSKKWKFEYTSTTPETDEQAQQGCQVQVQLYAVDQERVAVEFRRVAGDSWYFFEHFRKIKVLLAAINDAVL